MLHCTVLLLTHMPWQMSSVAPTVTNAQDYFQYLGSETSPPCAEGVMWLVLKNPLDASVGDIRAISDYTGMNRRPLQPVNGRAVFDSRMV